MIRTKVLKTKLLRVVTFEDLVYLIFHGDGTYKVWHLERVSEDAEPSFTPIAEDEDLATVGLAHQAIIEDIKEFRNAG